MGEDNEELFYAGNMNYRSPEMSREDEYSFKTDIYSMGLVFLEILMPELVNSGKKCKVFKNTLESGTVANYFPGLNLTVINE